MMFVLILLLLASIAPFIRFYISERRHYRIAKAAGCSPPKNSFGGILGLKSFVAVFSAWRTSQVLSYFEKLHRSYGSTFEMKVLPQLRLPVIFTISPSNIDALLASQFMDFGLGVHRQGPFAPFSGKGIFTSDGAEWSHTRGLLRPQFHKARISDLGRFSVHVERFLNSLPKDGSEFDIQDKLFKLFTDASMEFLLGESPNCQLDSVPADQSEIFPSSKDKDDFGKAFDCSQEFSVLRLFSSPFHYLINPPKFRKANKVIHLFVDHYIDKSLDGAKGHQSDKGDEKYMFLEALAQDTKDRKVLREHMLNILFAARDDPASLLSSIFYLLARDKRVWHKLRDLVAQSFRSSCEQGDSDEITAQKINQDLPYLHYVINEGLRLFPPVPTNARVALRDTSIPVGGGLRGHSPVYVKKGQIVAYSIYALHRTEEIWGADADEFRPERWETFSPKPFEFAPFSGGPRICVGQQQAILQVSYVLIKVLLRFESLQRGTFKPELGSRPFLVSKLSIAHKAGVRICLMAKEVA